MVMITVINNMGDRIEVIIRTCPACGVEKIINYIELWESWIRLHGCCQGCPRRLYDPLVIEGQVTLK